MKNRDLHCVQHIKVYCEHVENAIRRFGNDYAIFDKDADYYFSVSMAIMQIGELSKSLSDDFKESTKDKMAWGKMRALRNMYAHEYGNMDKLVTWEIATLDMPDLSRFCDEIIQREYEKGNPELQTDAPKKKNRDPER